MTSKQATATGMITKWEGTEEAKCSLYSSLKGYPDARVAAGSTQGVQVIDGRPGLRTPEGIGIGSSESAVRDAYSGWKVAAADDPVGDHRGFVKVPGNADAYYRMMIKNKKVSELALESADQSCYE
ncbi:hypothetical protein [Actinoplanes sp. TFC3]|uniref:hypothetical protein n=1 Tax=Actinoplanes sp. TFC3 TaxID=1710355 RepID=UPI00082CED16|nr:hypothetical protein [Actinoplanes sp. TFC3]